MQNSPATTNPTALQELETIIRSGLGGIETHSMSSASRRVLTSRTTFMRWVDAGRVTPLSKIGGVFWFSKTDLDELRAEVLADMEARVGQLTPEEVSSVFGRRFPSPVPQP